MGMPAVQHDWTVEKAHALPEDGKRYEVLDGELHVTPSPSFPHQWVAGQLFALLWGYLRADRLGWVQMAPADVVYSPRRLLQPDLRVVPWREGGRPARWEVAGGMLLAVEVLSPSTARADRGRKRLIYRDERVPEYWIVDLDARLVERWRPEDSRAELVSETLEWQPRTELAPLRIDLPAFFSEVLGR